MRIFIAIVRILMGLLLLNASIGYFFHLYEGPAPTGDMKTFSDGMDVTVYMMPLVKALELLCGLAFVAGKFPTLANIVIFPIVINILLIHAFMGPENIVFGAFLFVGNILLFYRYWDNYRSLLRP